MIYCTQFIESCMIFRLWKQREDCFQKAVIKRDLGRMRRNPELPRRRYSPTQRLTLCCAAFTCGAVKPPHAHRLLRPERNSQMKNGPPSIAVITPTGISLGASAVRATVSQSIRNPPPTQNDVGTSNR